jgi:DNA modification methylase
MLTIKQGDALAQLRLLPDESVQCCVTSPPYWGLRDYGNAGQLGLEKTPDEYVAKMVEVFREVRRVLKSDGTLWLNLGDSYATGGGAVGNCPGGGKQGERWARGPASHGRGEAQNRVKRGAMGKHNYIGDGIGVGPMTQPKRMPIAGLKPKDLVGIPWMVAFALRSEGWWLRQDIIWSKPNPMPESVTDRCTKAHEYLFLLTKSERYYYDAKAIAEGVTCERLRGSGPIVQPGTGRNDVGSHGDYRKRTNGKHSTTPSQSSGRRMVDNVATARLRGGSHDSPFGETRNKRSVWTVTTRSFPDAHFATYPPDLIKPCILAGSKPGDTILDPFAGSGTTGMVALELGRKALLIELNPEYVKLIHQRCDVTPGLALA